MATPEVSSDEGARWHWSEGMKFALEGIKLLFLLNGASAVAILTFIGNMKVGSHCLVVAMAVFAVGAAMPVVSMVYAYLTQLHYGNASFSQWVDRRSYKDAMSNHGTTYLFIGLGIAFFVFGIILAAIGFWHMPHPPTLIMQHTW